MKRSYPPGQVAYAGEGPCNNRLDIPAKSETITGGLLVPPGMYFAMPQPAGANLSVGEDGRTMTLVDAPNGWTYTFTLRIVKQGFVRGLMRIEAEDVELARDREEGPWPPYSAWRAGSSSAGPSVMYLESRSACSRARSSTASRVL